MSNTKTDGQRYAIKAEGQKPIFLPPGVEFGGVTRHAGEHSCEVGAPVTVHIVNPDGSLGPVLLTSRAHAWRPPRSFTDAQLIERDAAIETRVRAEVAEAVAQHYVGVPAADVDPEEEGHIRWSDLQSVILGSSPDTTPESAP